jgi:hypothetical protein
VVAGGVRGPRVSYQAVARVSGALGTHRSTFSRSSSGTRPRTLGGSGRRGGGHGLFRVWGGLRERRGGVRVGRNIGGAHRLPRSTLRKPAISEPQPRSSGAMALPRSHVGRWCCGPLAERRDLSGCGPLPEGARRLRVDQWRSGEIGSRGRRCGVPSIPLGRANPRVGPRRSRSMGRDVLGNRAPRPHPSGPRIYRIRHATDARDRGDPGWLRGRGGVDRRGRSTQPLLDADKGGYHGQTLPQSWGSPIGFSRRRGVGSGGLGRS